MISVKDRYFGLNRKLLVAVGLWPYQNSKLDRLHSHCVYTILITSIIVELTPFLTSECTADFFIKTLSFAFASICLIIKYTSFYVNSDKLKYLIEELQNICNNLRDNEIVIIDKYGNIAKYITTTLTMLLASGSAIIIVTQIYSMFFEVNSSVNTSQQQRYKQIIMTEYFIDQEKYFYFIFLHTFIALGIGAFSLIATIAMLIAYLYQACGMFRIASFRIEHTMQNHKHKEINMVTKLTIYRNIIFAVDIQRKAITYSMYIASSFEMTYFFLIIFGVITLSLNIFRIFQSVTSTCDINEFTFFFVMIVITFVYTFVANFIGQEIIDHYNNVFAAAYNIPWYIFPLHLQRLILLLLQRGNKTFGLNIGGLFVGSLQCFATLINASISYFTLMYSVQ